MKAASELNFEEATRLRDIYFELKSTGEKNGKRKKIN